MGKPSRIFTSIWQFYRDGFRNMTWGKPLVWLILLKLFILFKSINIIFERSQLFLDWLGFRHNLI